ncbi:hypothetical protein [Streptomyces californicus]|uniref:hypothetical protein n=1 Tax=Streptomyces californicus TaxID=67351 RepID=UPI003721D468
MTIDEAADFFAKFLTAVHEQDEASLTEPDEELERRIAYTESFMHSAPGSSMSSPFMRPRGMSAERLAGIEERAATPVRRPVYLVAQYEVPGRGRCFAADVGGAEEANSLAYELRYWATQIGDEPKIIAQYGIDFGTDPLAWEHLVGAVIGPVGDPVKVLPLERPRIPRDRENYERIVAAGRRAT